MTDVSRTPRSTRWSTTWFDVLISDGVEVVSEPVAVDGRSRLEERPGRRRSRPVLDPQRRTTDSPRWLDEDVDIVGHHVVAEHFVGLLAEQRFGQPVAHLVVDVIRIGHVEHMEVATGVLLHLA